jgi:inner membrane protein
MDPITHTLVGAGLARTGLGRLGGLAPRLAGAVLIAGANLPDVDVACYFVGSDFALEHRRGWTHGVLAMAVLPVLLAGLGLAWDRARRRPGRPAAGARAPARFGPLLALSAIAVWSHPLLDWLNTYGVRFLSPFDWTWFYGDAVYIVDPWLWLVLGGALILSRLGSPERTAAAGLALAALYAGAQVAWTVAGRALILDALESRSGWQVDELMVGPEPVDPFHRQVVARVRMDPGEGALAGYRLGRLSWLEGIRVALEPGLVPGPELTAPVRAALAAPSVRGFVTWARFPSFEVEPAGAGFTVHLIDLRYARRPESGFGTGRVELDAGLRPIPP